MRVKTRYGDRYSPSNTHGFHTVKRDCRDPNTRANHYFGLSCLNVCNTRPITVYSQLIVGPLSCHSQQHQEATIFAERAGWPAASTYWVVIRVVSSGHCDTFHSQPGKRSTCRGTAHQQKVSCHRLAVGCRTRYAITACPVLAGHCRRANDMRLRRYGIVVKVVGDGVG